MDRTKWGILIFTVLIVLAGLFLIFGRDQGYQWGVYLRPDGDQPYDMKYFTELMETSIEDQEVTFLSDDDDLTEILQEDKSRTTLLFYGNYTYPDQKDLNAILEHAEEGGTVVFLTPNPPENLLFNLAFSKDSVELIKKWLAYEADSAVIFPDTIRSRFNWSDRDQMDSVIHDFQWTLERDLRDRLRVVSTESGQHVVYRIDEVSFPVSYQVIDSAYSRNWEFIDPLKMKRLGLSYTEVGYLDNHPDLIRIQRGKGSFILHVGAFAFTNILVKEDGYGDHLDAFLKLLPSRPLIIDKRERNWENPFWMQNQLPNFQSPLSFILSEPALRWAWYILLIGALGYVVLQSRRTQKVIPPIPPLTNNTLSFAKALGKLRFKRPDHNRMAREVFIDLHSFVRRRFRFSSFSGKKEEWDQLIHIFPSGRKIIQRLAFLDQKRERTSLEAWELKELFNLRVLLLKQLANERRKYPVGERK
ncbi:MAG: DUF4350 domain-containing protein [Bacteroidota bacterium]|nr:DUF4350 domain-containing protein [Bacteroidota bacterium]MDX5506483.1 DUF4350 domain-containing protein [Bacteroidota bacterium]